MCGRFYTDSSVTVEVLREIAREVERRNREDNARFGEISPTNIVEVIARDEDGSLFVEPMGWGYTVMHRDDRTGAWSPRNVFNAKSETVATLKSFADSIKQGRRCVIPARYYYEWYYKDGKGAGKKGTKKAMVEADTDHLIMAGIWREEEHIFFGERVKIKRFTILTRPPAPGIAYVHDRMPLILSADQAREWLADHVDIDSIVNSAVEDIAVKDVAADKVSIKE